MWNSLGNGFIDYDTCTKVWFLWQNSIVRLTMFVFIKFSPESVTEQTEIMLDEPMDEDSGGNSGNGK